ncbi:hypothetical protein H6P81_009796 [Aristolochia fimbriata]|uniref:Uncharacterized protein n=1 Tax=Aristolochia fimbriata TaxID=158543 RepID=A0AAV7EPL5_ARIFI|nr:hypothetical protein H6P81_009796 [Aristolochia fimbriata]
MEKEDAAIKVQPTGTMFESARCREGPLKDKQGTSLEEDYLCKSKSLVISIGVGHGQGPMARNFFGKGMDMDQECGSGHRSRLWTQACIKNADMGMDRYCKHGQEARMQL